MRFNTAALVAIAGITNALPLRGPIPYGARISQNTIVHSNPSEKEISPHGISTMIPGTISIRSEPGKDGPVKGEPKFAPQICAPWYESPRGNHNCGVGHHWGRGGPEGNAKPYPGWDTLHHEFPPGTTPDDIEKWDAEHQPDPESLTDASSGLDPIGENELHAATGPQSPGRPEMVDGVKQHPTLWDVQNGPVNGVDYSQLNNDLMPMHHPGKNGLCPKGDKEGSCKADTNKKHPTSEQEGQKVSSRGLQAGSKNVSPEGFGGFNHVGDHGGQHSAAVFV